MELMARYLSAAFDPSAFEIADVSSLTLAKCVR